MPQIPASLFYNLRSRFVHLSTFGAIVNFLLAGAEDRQQRRVKDAV